MTRSIAPRMYLGAVIAAGAALLVASAPRELHNPLLAAALAGATVALSLFKLRLPLGNGVSTMSLAYGVDFVALIVESVSLAMVLGAIGVLIQCTVRVRRRQPIHRAAFSAAAVVVAVQAAAWAWNGLGGTVTNLTLTRTLMPLIACAIAYYIANTSLVVGAIAVTSSVGPARAWNPEFWWSAPAYLLSALIAALVALAIVHDVIVLMPLVASPLYACYCAYEKRWTEMAALHPAAAPATT
jgi:hypothetical protein